MSPLQRCYPGGTQKRQHKVMPRKVEIPTNGKLLTAEQSLRLAIMDSVDRDKVIAGIAMHLRRAANPYCHKTFYGSTPRHWYSAQVRSG